MASPMLAIRINRSPARQRMLARLGAGYREVRDALRTEVAPLAIRIMEEVVENWDNKPQFAGASIVDPNEIKLFVEPFGPNAKYWEWTSRGTRPHIIRARRVPFLIFRDTYEPKTTPGPPPTWGGPGTSSGDYVRKKEVQHPGTTPRHFEEYVANRVVNDFRRIVENAIKRGIRKG